MSVQDIIDDPELASVPVDRPILIETKDDLRAIIEHPNLESVAFEMAVV